MNEICLICDEKFEHESSLWARRFLVNHLKKIHNLENIDYQVKYLYNGKHPTCACGCGKLLHFSRGKFLKYYNLQHKNSKQSQDEKKTRKENHKRKYQKENLEEELRKNNISKKQLESYYQEFIEIKKNLKMIAEESNLHRRTIIRYWKLLGFIENIDEFHRISKIQQKSWVNPDSHKIKINEEIILEIYDFIKTNKNKFTPREIRDKFIPEISTNVMYRRLKENFNQENIDECFKFGNSSKAEIEFFNVLKWYFGKDIKQNFKIGRKIYDYILNSKLLIEFDGEYWHDEFHSVSDKIKNEIAFLNGYKIYRVRERKSKNIEILLEIKKLAYEN
jgi:hypothetical protein